MGGLSYPLLSDTWPYGYVCVQYGVLARRRAGGAGDLRGDQQGILRYIDIHDIAEQPPTEQDHGGARQAEVMMEKPLELSRYCVPFTPFVKPLEESLVCLVTTAAVRGKADTPFNVEGDNTFRRNRLEPRRGRPGLCDAHYDHACIDRDINCVFPIDRLASLAREGRIAGTTAEHFSMGYSQAPARAARDQPFRKSRAPSRPRGPTPSCSRAADGSATAPWSRLQRAIEMLGISTVLITVEPEESAQARPPRALCPAASSPATRSGAPTTRPCRSGS